MRIALLYSGHIRSLRRTFASHAQYVNRLRKHHDVTVFVHSWDVSDSGDAAWWRAKVPASDLADGVIDRYRELNPAVITVDAAAQYTPENLLPSGILGHEADAQAARTIAGMWDSIERVYKAMVLHEEQFGVEFDAVVRVRPDVIWNIPEEIREFEKNRISRFPLALGVEPTPSDLGFVLNRNDASGVLSLKSSTKMIRARLETCGYGELVAETVLREYLHLLDIDWLPFVSNVAVIREGKGTFVWPSGSDHLAAQVAGIRLTRAPIRLISGGGSDAEISEMIRYDVAFNTQSDFQDLVVQSSPTLMQSNDGASDRSWQILAELTARPMTAIQREFLSKIALDLLRRGKFPRVWNPKKLGPLTRLPVVALKRASKRRLQVISVMLKLARDRLVWALGNGRRSMSRVTGRLSAGRRAGR